MESDAQLLQEYLDQGSQRAFTALVERHLGLVYAAALRQVGGDAHLARDAAQAVFLALAQAAPRLRQALALTGWLYTTTRFAAAKIVRERCRRDARERSFQLMESVHASGGPEPDWAAVRSVLDASMHALPSRDREAILHRYFEGRSYAEVGALCGLSENAARMRVERALEKLREGLARRGIRTSGAAVGAALMAQAVTAAPAGLAGAVVASALAPSGAAVVSLSWFVNSFHPAFMTFAQKTVVTLLLSACVAGGFYQYRRLTRQNEELTALHKQADVQQAEIRELRRKVAPPPVASVAAADESPLSPEVRGLQDTLDKLKNLIVQDPKQRIPEMAYLKPSDWLGVAERHPDLDTDRQIRGALADLRMRAELKVLPGFQAALLSYLKDSNGVLPTDVSQLAPYLGSSVDPAVLSRYEMMASGPVSALPKSAWVVGEKVSAAVDDAFDPQVGFSTNFEGATSMGDLPMSVVNAYLRANQAYEMANQGQSPAKPADLQPYFSDPNAAAAYLASRKERGAH